MSELITIAKIRTDGGTQPRAELNWLIIADYAEQMQEGAQFPPVTVYYDGAEYWLAGGFHRIAAAKKCGMLSFPADVRQGTQEDAIIASCAENATHGLRRTNDDKQRAVRRVLELRPGWSDRKIAEHCAVNNSTVSRARAESGVALQHLPTREGMDGKHYPAAPRRPLRPEVQDALTDLAFQAPDDAPAFIHKALDERLAPDAIHHITEIVTDPETPDVLKEHILEPGEMVHDRQGNYAPSEPFRAAAQATAETPEYRGLPMDRYLSRLDGYRTVDSDVLASWIETSTANDLEACEELLTHLCEWAEHVKRQIADSRRRGLRVVNR